MNTNIASAPTLEEKIVHALTDEAITSRSLGFLSAETETAIITADNDAEVAEAIALDPLQSPDLHKARATVEDVKFRATRLRSLLPKLQARYDCVAEKEKYATWIDRHQPLQSRRDALEEEIKCTYAAAVAKLVPLLDKIAPLNAEVSLWCRSKPSGQLHDGDDRWLTAIPTPKELVLPDPESNKNLWPPKPHQWGIETPTQIFSMAGDEWWKVQQAEGARARIEDARRADALQAEEGRVRNDPKLWRRG